MFPKPVYRPKDAILPKAWPRAGLAAALVFFALPQVTFSAGERCAAVLVRQSTVSPANAALERQIMAIRASIAKRQCSGREQGFFNACRDLTSRLSSVMAKLQKSSTRQEIRCQPLDVVEQRRKERSRQPHRPVTVAGKLETMCVRLSDGYFFPTPNSGYNKAADEPLIQAQCAMICATPDVEVFGVRGDERSVEDLFSLKTGKAYTELKNAGAYRIAPKLQRCDMARYVNIALNADKVTPGKADRKTGKDRVRITLAKVDFLMDMDLRLTPLSFAEEMPVVHDEPKKKIRIVSPPFLPAAE